MGLGLMRFVATLFVCLLVPTYVAAKPSQWPVTEFAGDRYASRVTHQKAAPTRKYAKVRYYYRVKKTAPRGSYRRPVRQYAPEPLAPPVPPTLAQGLQREIGRAFIRGRLICAANVGAELARRGIKGTGSRLAMSYRSWGRPSGPVPGAVAVFGRRGGGHVAIVHSVQPNGQVIYLNPSSRRQAWVVGPYRRQPIAFRVAS